MTVDQRGPVGLHTRGNGLTVERVGVFGIALESGVGEALGLGDAVVEALLGDWVDGRALAGDEAIVVGEEFDIEDAETVELGEDKGGRVGGGAEGILRMGGHPLLEVAVGGVKFRL